MMRFVVPKVMKKIAESQTTIYELNVGDEFPWTRMSDNG
jgi:hypothetical protein